MDSAFLITAFVTLLVVIDPIGLTPIFIALTSGADSRHRRTVALRACAVGAAVLFLFAFLGESVLNFIGISMAAFRISGGILLFITALDMLFERRTKRREDTAEQDADFPDPSVFPIAIPLIAGPGAIASVILLTGQTSDALGMASVLAVLVGVLLIVLVFFFSAGLVERALGKTGITVVTRLLGMLLAALSVQFVLDGLRAVGVTG
ncbi:MarC family protein [Puniceibacterium confluentis]|uniref:MarC family protein n=1 Tax=Puniceibacterium confluentis TaxID=1958944 RepID=UPI0011B6E62A|nr:MarC family protein [Puniceibacterium confluentis]